MYRMYSNRSLSFSYFRAILFGGRGAYIREGLLLFQFYFLGGLLLELKPPGLVLEKGLLLERVRYVISCNILARLDAVYSTFVYSSIGSFLERKKKRQSFLPSCCHFLKAFCVTQTLFQLINTHTINI